MLAEPFTHSPGFGGLMAVVAAIIASGGVAITVIQRGRTARRDEWWSRFVWLLDRSADLGSALTTSMLDQLTTSARKLRDDDLLAFAERCTENAYIGASSADPRHEAHNGPEQNEGDRR